MNYSLDYGKLAKDILRNMSYMITNFEQIDYWKGLAVAENVEQLYNTPDFEI